MKIINRHDSTNDYSFDSGFKFSIHNYIGYGEQLFLSCYELNFNKTPLSSKNIEDAEKETMFLLKERVEYYKNSVDDVCKEFENKLNKGE